MKWYVPGDKYPNRSAPDKFPGSGEPITAKDRTRALWILGGAGMVRPHPYDRSPHSGAGNCWCGRSKTERIHAVEERADWVPNEHGIVPDTPEELI